MNLYPFMPTQQALQVFYGVLGGTLPLAGVLLWAALGQRMLLQDILKRLAKVEEKIGKVGERLAVIETRLGIIVPAERAF